MPDGEDDDLETFDQFEDDDNADNNLAAGVDWDENSKKKAAERKDGPPPQAKGDILSDSPFKPGKDTGDQKEAPPPPPDAGRETKKAEAPPANPLQAVPREFLGSTQRAMEALQEVQEGKPITEAVKAKLEAALKDASKLDDQAVADIEKKMEESLRTTERKINGGLVLPKWTKENEETFWKHLTSTQKAFAALPEETQARVASLEAELKATPFGDMTKRSRILTALREEADAKLDPSGKVAEYFKQQAAMEKFTRENAAGLNRRTLHLQELNLLHSKALVSTIYAAALDRAGGTVDRAKIDGLIKTAAADKHISSSFPDVARLQDKYKVIEKDPLDEKIPGRETLKKALDIMNDPRQGTIKERLEKASPLFQQAIGASDQIDAEKANERLKAIAKEAAELGENGDPKKLDELDKEAVLLIEQLKQPGLTRMAFAMALNKAGVELKDATLNERALTMLKSIEKIDPGAKYDEMVQGAIKIASENPPGLITEKDAVEKGVPAVASRKEEDKKQGKEDETPTWQKLLRATGEFAAGMIGWYALSKLARSIRQGPIRGWEASRRVAGVTAESSPAMKEGQPPRVVIKTPDGKEKEVTGVRKEDGLLRVKDGDKVELTKLNKGDKLVVQTPEGTKLTPEQAKEVATKVLTPNRVEEEVAAQKQQYEEKLRLSELEAQQLRDANTELQKQATESKNKEVLTELHKQVTEGPLREAYERLLKSPQGGADLVADILKMPKEIRKDSGLDAALEKGSKGTMHEIREAYRRAAALQQIDVRVAADLRPALRKLAGTTEGLGLVQRILTVPNDILNDAKIPDALAKGEPAEIRKLLQSAEQKILERRAAELAPIPGIDKVLTPEELRVVEEVRRQQEELQRTEGAKQKLTTDQVQARVDAYFRGEGHAAKSVPPGGVRNGKVIHIVMGLPGAGKTSAITEPLAARYGARLIDSDMIKPDLPGYRNGMGNQLLHTPSGQIADAVLAEGLARGENLLYSTIGRTPESVYLMIEQARAQGYRVAVHFADVSPEASARRVYDRGYQGDLTAPRAEPRQLIPPSYSLEGAGHRPRIVFDMITRTPGLVDAWQHIDTNTTTSEGRVIPKMVGQNGLPALEDHVPPPTERVGGPPSTPAADTAEWRKIGEMPTSKETIVFKRGNKGAGDIDVRNLNAEFNPDKPGEGYLELKFEGRPPGARYFVDPKTREVFVYSENKVAEDLSLKTMTRTFDVEVLPPAQAEARLARTTTEAPAQLPTELVRATTGGSATGSVEMMEMDAVTGRLKRTRVGLAAEVPRIGELNERTIDGLVKGWERDLDKEIERLKGDPDKVTEYNELVKQKEAMAALRGELAAGGERARKVVEHFQRSIEPGAEVPHIPESGGRWRGRVAVGGGVVIGIGILVAAGLGYHNRFIAPKKEKQPGGSSLPRLK